MSLENPKKLPYAFQATDGWAPLSLGALHLRNALVLFAMVALGQYAVDWQSPDLLKYFVFLGAALALCTTRLSTHLNEEEVPASLVVVLFSIEILTPSETIVLAALTALAPGLWKRVHGQRGREQFAFHSALITIAATGAVLMYSSPWLAIFEAPPAARLGVAAFTLFLTSSAGQAALRSLNQQGKDEDRSFIQIWLEISWPLLKACAIATVVAHGAAVLSELIGWESVVITGPALYLVYRTYELWVSRLEDGRVHAEEMAALHLRTIEALALAIDAKDHTTHEHLKRVKTYAHEVAVELGLSDEDQQALQAAALLHDIGKLAVPEHIISKPGRLTPDEFEKMKIHPIVGAEILERVRFPYPVAPIVRAHHERWDGTGYPSGLSREQIPIGARILSAVDCLDALATDRQYRRALPLHEAMKVVEEESGKAFDPRVVEILSRRYVELEQKAQGSNPRPAARLSTEVKVGRGEAPAAGFEKAPDSSSVDQAKGPGDFLSSIAAARQEVQTLFEISHDLGNSLSLDETLSLLSMRLRPIVPHHAAAIWLCQKDILVPGHVSGEDYRLFSSMTIPMGQGLSGWVAQNAKPIVNGNPAVETGHLNDVSVRSSLKAAVAVPLEGHLGVVGVLTLYHLDRDAFTRDHLRILAGISTKIGLVIENALRLSRAETTATTDFVTNLPNARSLFLQLDQEVARAKREHRPLTVLVLDMDGLKQVNDRNGHLEGNRLLGEVAAGIKSVCRDYDYVARMGGDEFVILLPGLDASETEKKLEQFRQAISASGTGLRLDWPVTASIGVATYPTNGTDAAQLLAEADLRMYQEKRNRKETRTSKSRRSFLERSGMPQTTVQ